MKTKKTLSLALVLVMILSLLAGCSAQQTTELQQAFSSDAVLSQVYPENGGTVTLHTKKQDSYLNKPFALMYISATGKKELSKPESVTLNWVYTDDEPAEKCTVTVSENENMLNPTIYEVTGDSLVLTNLKIATTYYWTVDADGANSAVYNFTTSVDAPRNISVDGVANVRDLGGWETESGTRTKQGLIYRCGRLNESSADTVNIEITEDGKNVMLGQLGIKSEIDLRKTEGNEVGGITSSPLGDTVTYYSCPMEWDGDMLYDNKEQVLRVFSILADENNYPVIYHCDIGTDRTGMISFLVNALLGVPEDDLIRDYMFSNNANIGGTRKASQMKNSGYYKAVAAAQGSSLSEKTYNCLVDLGVPSDQLDKVIEILG